MVNTTAMKNKICLITGGTSGVGKAIATGLSLQGATCILTTRHFDTGGAVCESIKFNTKNDDIDVMQVDLSSQTSIRTFASTFRNRFDRLDILCNTAGVLFPKCSLTEDGIETTFATNYLSAFLLTHLMLPLLKSGIPSRILNVSGSPGILKHIRIHFEDIEFRNHYNGFKAAAQSVFAKLIFTFELAKRLKDTGVSVNAFHPGLIRSQFGRHLPWPLRFAAILVQPLFGTECKNGIYVASSSDITDLTGQYFVNQKATRFTTRHYKETVGEKLWQLSESYTKIHFFG